MHSNEENKTILKVKDLSIVLGEETIVNDLSFEVSRGEYITIIGSNGSGKTTLFRALIGAIPYAGTIEWAPGIVLGYVPQRLDIDRDVPLSLRDFLESKKGHVKRHDLLSYLDLVGLPHAILKRPLGSLSGGEFQRALVGFALLGNTNALLFDEPTASIDKPSEEHIYTMLHRLQHEKQLTILTISHDLNFVQQYAEKVLCLNRKKYFFGDTEEGLQPQRLADLYGDTQYKFFKHAHDS